MPPVLEIRAQVPGVDPGKGPVCCCEREESGLSPDSGGLILVVV